MSKSNLLSFLSEVEEIKPVAKINGVDVYTFDDSYKRNKARMLERKAGTLPAELAEYQLNHTKQCYKSLVLHNVAVDTKVLYQNCARISTIEEKKIVKVMKEMEKQKAGRPNKDGIRETYTEAVEVDEEIVETITVLEVVIDERAIETQKTRQPYANLIPAHKFHVKDKEATYIGMVNIVGEKFCDEFIDKLSEDDMKKIIAVLDKKATNTIKEITLLS